jgi:tRNA-dihydrouridine synthase B
VEFYGDEHGAKLFRKVAPWYAKRFGPAKPFKQRITSITSRADFEAAIAEYLVWRAQFCDARGELLGKYVPARLMPSFMREPGDPEVFAPQAIPVPKGPVDVW